MRILQVCMAEVGEKRPLDPDDDDDDDDDDDGFGPMPVPAPAQTKPKKRKVLKNAHVYLDNLPKGEMYEKSLFWSCWAGRLDV